MSSWSAWGPGGEVAVDRRQRGANSAIERELIGGECGYWACIPPKTLLRLFEARSQARPFRRGERARRRLERRHGVPDYLIRYLDDSKHVAGYEQQGVTVVKALGPHQGIRPGQGQWPVLAS